MFAEFKGIHSPDCDLESFCPNDPENFSVFVQAFFGPKDEEGSESFGFTVCTPGALARELGDGLLFMRHYIIVSKFDYSELVAHLEKLATSISGSDWHELALKLCRFGHWEFEDYTPPKN